MSRARAKPAACSRLPAAACTAALLAACVAYHPQPRAPERIATGFAERSLDDARLRGDLDRQLPARSGAWPRAQWDRADLLIAMLHFSDALAEGRASARAASAATRTAREFPNPSVNFMAEYANQHDGSPLWLWALTTDWLLDAAGKRSARIAVADLGAQRAAFELAELAWKERGALRRSAADLLLTEREISLREAVRTDRQAQLDMARHRLEAGAASRGDLDRLVSDALADEQQLHDARRRASQARSALAGAIGVPVAALKSVKLEWEQLDNPPDVAAALLGEARSQALLARADVHAAVVGYSVAEQSLRLEVAKQYPDVHLGPAFTWDHGVKRYQFNLGMTLPLLNRNRGAIGEAEARREEAGAHLEAIVAAAWREIDEAIRQWQLARLRLEEAHGPVYDAARRIYAQTVHGFDAGANDRTELVAARVASTLAELQVLDAARTAQEALANLEDALRRPLEGPELTLAATPPAPPVPNAEVAP